MLPWDPFHFCLWPCRKKQSLARINPIEPDSFHQPGSIRTVSCPSTVYTHTHSLKTCLWEQVHPFRDDLSAYWLTCSPGDTEVHYDRLGSAKGLHWSSAAKCSIYTMWLHYHLATEASQGKHCGLKVVYSWKTFTCATMWLLNVWHQMLELEGLYKYLAMLGSTICSVHSGLK